MPDRRDPDRIRHEMFEMVMARTSAIACGRLRHIKWVVYCKAPFAGPKQAPSAAVRPVEAGAQRSLPQVGSST
jgi:hypothetical protein